MLIVSESAVALKRFLADSSLKSVAAAMVLRMVLAFLLHRGRMSCSQGSASVAAETVHRGELTRFLARPRWQKHDWNAPLRAALLKLESRRGKFLLILDATEVSQSGKKTQNTFSKGNRQRRPAKGRRYHKRKVARRACHMFTFALLITPSGIRIPWQVPYLTRQYCAEQGLMHRTTAEAAAELIRMLPLPKGAEVIVIGDTAYDAQVVRRACAERDYLWIFPANPERVYQGPRGQRPKLHTRLKDWTRLSPKTLRLRASTGKYAVHRRLSRWRLGPKQKPRVYYAHRESATVYSVGCVQLVFSTMKPNLSQATPDDVKILMTNAVQLSTAELLELYAVRWQIELFFKELKSTLGFAQYSLQSFTAVRAWVEIALTTVLFLEQQRAKRLQNRRSSTAARQWWASQRLYGLATAFRHECHGRELKYLSARLKTPGGIARLLRQLTAALPPEYRLVS